MRERYYSSGKEKSGGFSGIKIFENDKINNLYIAHGSSTSMNAEYKKALHLDFYLCGLKIECIFYDDYKDYKTILDWIQNVKNNPDAKDIISIKIIKLCVNFIANNKQFDVISVLNSVFDAGVKSGRLQKVNEFKNLLNED